MIAVCGETDGLRHKFRQKPSYPRDTGPSNKFGCLETAERTTEKIFVVLDIRN